MREFKDLAADSLSYVAGGREGQSLRGWWGSSEWLSQGVPKAAWDERTLETSPLPAHPFLRGRQERLRRF